MKHRIAVVGYGNIGQSALEALRETPDLEIAGVVVRSMRKLEERFSQIPVVTSFDELKDVEGVLLCAPTLSVPELAETYLQNGVCCVDSFDIHAQIAGLRSRLNPIAQAHKAVSVISAGWDPGSDSVIRAMLIAMAPVGMTYTNFGPGMSMGHTVAVKAIEGVKDALSVTIPLGTSIHRRMVYIELKDGYELDDVAARIKADAYFVNDETHVILVESVNAIMDVGHAVLLERKGVSGIMHNQMFRFEMKMNNPALTAQIMVASMRAALRMKEYGRYGCYTMIELAPVDLLPGKADDWVKKLV